jgi:tripartite-type tricarboxylate transporter receptor subunit TctC
MQAGLSLHRRDRRLLPTYARRPTGLSSNEDDLMSTPRIFLLAAACISVAAHGAATDYPTKPVRIIVPFSPGAAADAVTRVLAKKLTDYWGKQVILDNRPGVPGVQVAANSPPDGYSLLLGAGSNIVTSPLMMTKAPYDPQKDLAPVSQVVNIPPILTTHPSLRVKTVKELIALAKAKPGQLNYSSSGMGAPNHLAMELFMVMTGTSMVHVPYKGAAPSVTEMVAGQVQLGFNAIPSVLQHVQNGKLKALAVSSAKRAKALPNLPTIAESAVPGFEYNIWYALFVPAKTPPDLVAKISTDVQRALKEPEVVQQLVAQGTEPAPSTPAALAQYIKEDTARWSRIVKEKNLKLE